MGEEGACSLSSALVQSLHLGPRRDSEHRANDLDGADERTPGRPLKPLPSSHHAILGKDLAPPTSPPLSHSAPGSDHDVASLADEGETGRELEWESKTTAPTSPAPSSPTSGSAPRLASQGIFSPMSETQSGKPLFRFVEGQSPYLGARRPFPAAVSQRDLRMLLPYWPRQEASQEVALVNASGEAGALILGEMEEQARLFAQERSSLTRSPRPSFSSATKSLHQSSRHGGAAGRSADEDEEIVQFHSAVSPPANHKKRKSSRSALEDPHYFGGSGVPDVTASSGHASGASYDDRNSTRLAAGSDTGTADNAPDKNDDDGIERPDVSSASFRASRLVDEGYAASASQADDHEHEWPTHGGRCEHHRHSLPWAHRGRRLLRSEVRLRLSLRRAQSEFWSDLALLEAEQEEEERIKREKLAAEAASVKAAAAEAEKKRRERTSKAEKRVQALKGGKSSGSGGAGKKLTLADLRARTALVFQRGENAIGQETVKASPNASEKPSSPSAALDATRQDRSSSRPVSTVGKTLASRSEKSPLTCEAPSGPFSFRCDSSTARELATVRLKLQAVLSKPFDDVVEDLDLPFLTHEARTSWDKGVADRRCVMIKAKAPMVWPEEDRPRAKFIAGTVSSEILRKMGVKVPEDRKGAKDFVFAPWDDLSVPIVRGRKNTGAASLQRSARVIDSRARNTGSEPEGKRAVSKAKAPAPSMTSDATVAGTHPRSAQRGDIPSCSQSLANQPCPATSPPSLSEVSLPLHDQHSASSIPSPSLSTSPSPPKTSPKMSRRKKANMNNIHHQLNSARWTTSPPNASTSANPSSTYTDSHQGGSSSHSRPITSSALFPDEYICLFCEYALFYGTRPLLLKACRHRKDTVKRKTQVEDKKKRREGKIAGTVPSSTAGDHHHDHTCTQCGCDISHQVSGGSSKEAASHHSHSHLAASEEGMAGPSVSTASPRPTALTTSTSSAAEASTASGRS